MKTMMPKLFIFIFIAFVVTACGDTSAAVRLEVTGGSDVVYVKYRVGGGDQDEDVINTLPWTKQATVSDIHYYSIKFQVCDCNVDHGGTAVTASVYYETDKHRGEEDVVERVEQQQSATIGAIPCIEFYIKVDDD
ncbi:MAG: hypothetical protein GY754_29210 [bacterium]|nr:hypothetical protein [bacterium]